MLTLLFLLSPDAQAVPLDLCANRGTGSVVGLGGQYLWEVDGNPDLMQPLWWSTLCGVGGNAAPSPTIVQPVEGMVVNGGELAEIAVSADAGDPEHGWGRCEWWVEKDGERFPLPVRLPGGTTTRTSLPFSRTNPVCSGVAILGAVPAGSASVGVTVFDLFVQTGNDLVGIRINNRPLLTLVEPTDPTVLLTGEPLTATVEILDDTVADVGSVVTFEVHGAGEPVSTSCTITTPGRCTTTLAAPLEAGAFDVVARYADEWERIGEVALGGFYANDVPGVVILTPADAALLETNEPTDIVVQVTDATASPGDSVSLHIDAPDGWSEEATCTLAADLSCAVAYTPDTNGEYTITAAYTDGYGEVGTSAPVVVLTNDTPTLTVSGLIDGALLEPGETPIDLVITVTDLDLPAGTLSGSVVGATGPADLTLGSLDATGVVSASVVLPVRDVYTATFTYTDAYGVSVTTDPIVVTTDQAPTVGLLTPSSGDLVQIPAGDTSYAFYSYSFEVADADGDALTVQPAAGFDDRVACVESTDGTGRWDCDLDTAGWAAGVYTIAVVVSDGLIEATDSFDVEVVEADDYDYDGDGVVAADTSGGPGVGDCAPYDPTVHGASGDGSVAAAPEAYDDLDNDCDGEVNNGLPDPEGGETISTATSITGTTQVLTSGSTIDDQGSLANDTDVDWWYFEVLVDRYPTQNASFTVTLEVPADSANTIAGDWQVVVWTESTSTGTRTQITPSSIASSCDTSTATCELTFAIRSQPSVDGENLWWIGITSDVCFEDMCTDSPADWSYILSVSS